MKTIDPKQIKHPETIGLAGMTVKVLDLLIENLGKRKTFERKSYNVQDLTAMKEIASTISKVPNEKKKNV